MALVKYVGAFSMDLYPVVFPGANVIMTPPPSWDAGTYGNCKDLPVMRRDGVSISCWRAEWLDRLRFLWRGKVYLHVVGGQPPVMLVIE